MGGEPFPENPDPEAGTTSRTVFQNAHRRGSEGNEARAVLARWFFGPALTQFRRRGLADAWELAVDFVVDFFIFPNDLGHYKFVNFNPAIEGSFRAYVGRSARNSSINALRKLGTERKHFVLFPDGPPDVPFEADPVAPLASEEEAWERTCALETFRRAIGALRDGYTPGGPALFNALVSGILKHPGAPTDDELIRQFTDLPLTVGMLKQRRRRLRLEQIPNAFRAQLLAEGFTEETVEDEIQKLLRLFG